MAYLKYYRNQRSVNADSYAVKADWATAQTLAQELFKFFNVPAIPFKLYVHGSREFPRIRQIRSWYESRGVIVMHPTMLTPATITHEVAHYVDHFRAKASGRVLKKWHTDRHAALIANGLDFLKKYHPEIWAPKAVVAPAPVLSTEQLNAKAIAAFYAGLPEKLTCPCCGAHIPKNNFGVRVMKRDTNGVAIEIRRQSYCKSCR